MLGKLSVYLPESRYTITPVKDGYVPTRRNIEIHMDETIDDLRITLCKTVGGGKIVSAPTSNKKSPLLITNLFLFRLIIVFLN